MALMVGGNLHDAKDMYYITVEKDSAVREGSGMALSGYIRAFCSYCFTNA